MKRITTTIVSWPFHAICDHNTVVFSTFGELPNSYLSLPQIHDHLVLDALNSYDQGDLSALDSILVSQPGTDFRQSVWAALRTITPETTITYQELAARAGRPRAIRAAASGCATNQVPLILPCHRVLASNGGLGGYAFGTELKTRLLEHEKASLIS